jgi:hypothetical protein
VRGSPAIPVPRFPVDAGLVAIFATQHLPQTRPNQATTDQTDSDGDGEGRGPFIARQQSDVSSRCWWFFGALLAEGTKDAEPNASMAAGHGRADAPL